MKLGNGLGLQYYRASGETPILDSFPGAQVAYSLRYLSSSYSGDVVLVRRSSDNSELGFTPTEINDGTLLTWVGGGNNGFVKTWYDQSGNSRNATQSTTTLQPKIVDAGSLVTLNGETSVLYDGSDDFLDIAGTSGISFATQSTFTVSRSNVSGAFRAIIEKANSNAVAGRELWVGINNASPAEFGSAAYNGLLCYGGNATNQILGTVIGIPNTSVTTYVNGSQVAQDTPGSNLSSTDNITISSDGGSYLWNGHIQEIILYSSDQSSNRTAIETAINSYYNIY